MTPSRDLGKDAENQLSQASSRRFQHIAHCLGASIVSICDMLVRQHDQETQPPASRRRKKAVSPRAGRQFAQGGALVSTQQHPEGFTGAVFTVVYFHLKTEFSPSVSKANTWIPLTHPPPSLHTPGPGSSGVPHLPPHQTVYPEGTA